MSKSKFFVVMLLLIFAFLSNINASDFITEREEGELANSFSKIVPENKFVDLTNYTDAKEKVAYTITYGPGFVDDVSSTFNVPIKKIDLVDGENILTDAYYIVNNAIKFNGKYYDVKTTYIKAIAHGNDNLYIFNYANPIIESNENLSFSNGTVVSPGGTVYFNTNESPVATNIPMIEVLTRVEIFDAGTNNHASVPFGIIGLLDVDRTEAYKFKINLSKDQFYIPSVESTEMIKYNEDTGVIWAYANFLDSNNKPINRDDANLYIRLLNDDISNFELYQSSYANSGLGLYFFDLVHTVTYKSDENGEITGVSVENVSDGYCLSGTDEKTKNDNYSTIGWKSNANVTLKNGTVIKKGELISSDDLANIIVNNDLELTVYHKEKELVVDVDNTLANNKYIMIAGFICSICSFVLLIIFYKKKVIN